MYLNSPYISRKRELGDNPPPTWKDLQIVHSDIYVSAGAGCLVSVLFFSIYTYPDIHTYFELFPVSFDYSIISFNLQYPTPEYEPNKNLHIIFDMGT